MDVKVLKVTWFEAEAWKNYNKEVLDAIFLEVALMQYSSQNAKSNLIEFDNKDITIEKGTGIFYHLKVEMDGKE